MLKMFEIIDKIKLNGFIIENTCDYDKIKESFDSIHDLIDDAMEIDETAVRHIQNHKTGTGYASIWNIAGFEFSLIENDYGFGFIAFKDESDAVLAEMGESDKASILDARTIRQCEKLGILSDVKSIIRNCECGENEKAYIHNLKKMRKWEIMEVIGNFLDDGSDDCPEDWEDIRMIKTFCKAWEIKESDLTKWYALGILEYGFSIAYAVNEDIVLILE